MLTAVQLFCLRVNGSVNVDASFLVAIMFPSVCISSFGTVVYCVVCYLHIKALEGYTFIYLFRYLFIYLFSSFFLAFVSITRKLRKEHQRA